MTQYNKGDILVYNPDHSYFANPPIYVEFIRKTGWFTMDVFIMSRNSPEGEFIKSSLRVDIRDTYQLSPALKEDYVMAKLEDRPEMKVSPDIEI